MFELYQKGIDAWRKMHNGYEGEVATLAIAGDGEAKASSNTACHAGLNGSEAKDFKKREYVVSGIQYSALKEHSRQLFIEWLTNRSPWQDVFPIKDAAALIDQGCLIGTANVPGNVLGAAMIASRFHSENKSSTAVNIMMEMVSEGVDETLAFIIAHYMGGDKTKVYFNSGDNCHSCLPIGIKLGHVKNVLTNNRVGAIGITYAEDSKYSGVFQLYQCKDGASFPTFLTKHFDIEVVKSVSINPFMKSEVEKTEYDNTKKYPRNKFSAAMADFQYNIFKELGYDQGIHNQQQRAV